jgi:hypothetical protein
MMADDYSWIDTWGMDSSDAGYYQDLIDFGVYNPAWYDSSAADGISGTDSSGFWSKLGAALGNTTGSLASGITGALGQSGLGTLAGMLGMGYGLKNQYDWQELLGQGRDLAGKTGSLVSGWTPYTNQTVNMSEAQKQLYNLSSGLSTAASDYYTKGLGVTSPELLKSASDYYTKGLSTFTPDERSQLTKAFLSSGTYDPSKVQSYVNPYVEGGLSAANRLTSQNLTENVLPEINSTFTGQGQFGSTRNAEFQNRAIRDTQQSIADANAKAMVGAYGQADTAYRDILSKQGMMGREGLTLAQQAQQLGGQLGYQGLSLGQQDIQQGGQLGYQGLNLSKDLATLPVEQYQKMFSSPLSMFNTWSQGVGNFNPAGATGTGNTGIDFSKLLGG